MTSSELKSKLSKTLEFLESELSQIRTGRATPNLIEEIVVEVYGGKMTVKELASIMVSDPQNLIVAPWDKSIMGDIAKAIRNSELKLNPVEESDKIRVPVPSLTEERRVEFTKFVTAKVEDAKQAIRNIRQDAMKDLENDFNNKLIGEDEKFQIKEEIEEVVKDIVKDAEDMGERKKTDLMRV